LGVKQNVDKIKCKRTAHYKNSLKEESLEGGGGGARIEKREGGKER
jgi:hypothetical protein